MPTRLLRRRWKSIALALRGVTVEGRSRLPRRGRFRPKFVLPAALLATAALAVPASAASAATGARSAHALRSAHSIPAAPPSAKAKPTIVYQDLKLPDHDSATVYSDGMAAVYTADHRSVEYRLLPADQLPNRFLGRSALPPKDQLVTDLSRAVPTPYARDEVQVVLRSGVSATETDRTVPAAVLGRMRMARTTGALTAVAPRYTTSAALNTVLGKLGVSTMGRLFSAASPATLSRLTRAAASAAGHPVLGLNRAYVLHVTGASVPAAVSKLLASPQVAYAAPDWTVGTMNTPPTPISSKQQAQAVAAQRQQADAAAAQRAPEAAARARSSATPGASSSSLPPLPTNYALTSSAQALLNKPGVDWVPAYETLESQYGQLPGTGETITDVSLGDLDSAGSSSDPCSEWIEDAGPTTIVQNGQRYLDLPSMPLIPTYTASSTATLDPTGEVCGVDPSDAEIDLDFAMMAPLPDNLQRPDAAGSGLTDLLGIAPGANYRLVVPANADPAISDIDAAFLAAAQQTPGPDVITSSLGFGLDSEGFPGRYLEDDPLTETLIYSLVHADHIVVSVSANDGTRTVTNAAVAPSGGSAATNVAAPGATPTSLNDIQFSTTPSLDPDSGSIAAGGTTLDDIFAAPPQDPANARLAAQHAFPEVRWDGSTSFSSGYGSRVNLSAPADNLISLEHDDAPYSGPTDVTSVIEGGTSASSQEIGAAAADVLQAARLSGDTALASDPVAVRKWLVSTGTPVPNVPQADQELHVGPQVDVGRAVDKLISAQSGFALSPGVARVAVEQRQPQPVSTELGAAITDAIFTTNTDPTAISLSGADQDAWITIAPDWTGTPAPGSHYSLTVNGQVLATTPFARLLPQQILAAAGQAFPPASTTSVTLTYQGTFCNTGAPNGCPGQGNQQVVTTAIPLTFTAASGSPQPLAPDVPPVVTGSTIPVSYNVANTAGFTSPRLVISEPGRVNPSSEIFNIAYSQALTSPSGTVRVPVSALHGGGIYGIAIESSPASFDFSDFAYTRVQDAPTDARPPAPLLSAPGSPPGHLLAIPYNGSFKVSWNVRGVPGAKGAMLEISAGGPGLFSSYNTFNNPNGTVRDSDGIDTKSLYFVRLHGASGTEKFSAASVGLYASMYHNVRVLPVTSDGAAAGEASDISTITRNGVIPSDGGMVELGFGVNQSGTDGFLTSAQITASGQILGSLETFSQKTGAITGTPAPDSSTDLYATLASTQGVFHGDVGLYEDANLSTGAVSFRTLNPVATGTPGSAWTPPASYFSLQGSLLPAENQSTDNTAVLSTVSGSASVFTSNIGADTFGPAYDITPETGSTNVNAIAQDTSTNTAIVASVPPGGLGPPTITTVNLSTGAASSFSGVGSHGSSGGAAVDSDTDTAIVPDGDNINIGIYNLATGAATDVEPGGRIYGSVAVDPSRSEFLVQELLPPEYFDLNTGTVLGTDYNNDMMSSVLVIGENGQVLRRLEQFNFLDISPTEPFGALQVNPATGTAYTVGPFFDQIEPFRYTG